MGLSLGFYHELIMPMPSLTGISLWVANLRLELEAAVLWVDCKCGHKVSGSRMSSLADVLCPGALSLVCKVLEFFQGLIRDFRLLWDPWSA